MRHLFTPHGDAALAAILQRQPLLAFDFDGTLAPIVARPDDVHLSPAVAAQLGTLADRFPLAIVTGRSVRDVRGRLGFKPRFIVGNHGAEEDAGVDVEPAPNAALARLRRRAHERAPRLEAAGVTIEDKGHSLALHFRLAPNRRLAQQAIAEFLHGMGDPLRAFGGKLVVNVVSRDAPDKADAVRSLLARCGASCALFAGDDVNDEPVFALAPKDWLTIRVGQADRRSRACYCLDSPAEMALLLERMVALVSAP